MPKTEKLRLAKRQVKNITEASHEKLVKMQRRKDIRAVASSAPRTTDEDASPEAQQPKTQPFENRIQAFKKKYQWDDTATMNLGEYLLGTIPEVYRDSGVSAMITNLDEAQQQELSSTVDERMLLQAIEKTMPEEIKPSFQRVVEKYKEEHAG